MITIHLKYVIDPYKVDDFEEYGRMWIPLVNKFGGTHHGYFLPSEGANNIAYALFSFPSMAAFEAYRSDSELDELVPLRDTAVRKAVTVAGRRVMVDEPTEPAEPTEPQPEA